MRKGIIAIPIAAALLICCCLVLGGCSGGSSGGGGGAAAASHTDLLWSVSRLEQEMAKDQDLVVLDCRINKANPGTTDPPDLVDYDNNVYKPGEVYTPYKIEHIKDAHYINFWVFGDPYYPTDDTEVISTLNALGITTSTKICLYDVKIGCPQGKVFYHLERLGCTDVHILDGGFPAWSDAGKPVETAKTPDRTPSNFVKNIDDSIYLELADFKAIWDKVEAGSTDYALIDYREDPLYQGHRVCPDTVRTGWIKNSQLCNWMTYMDSAGYMKSPEDIIKLTEAAGGGRNKTNVLICNKGWRSGFTYFALRYVGFPKTILKHFLGGVKDWAFQDEVAYPMPTEACYRLGRNMPLATNTGSVNQRRFCGAAGMVGSKLYCIGGYEPTDAKSTMGKSEKIQFCAVNQAFDMLETNLDQQWTNDLLPLPEPVAFSAGASIDGYVYVIGGITGTPAAPVVSNKVYQYDTTTNTWAQKTSMPDAGRLSYAAATVGRHIYVFGGLTSTDSSQPANYSNDFMRYNHDTDQWEVLSAPNTPHARRCHALVGEGDLLYLVAGFYKEDDGMGGINNVDLKDVWVIDTTDLAAGWAQMADLPMDVAGHSAAIAANKKIYVLGGWSMDGVKYDVLEYDTVSNTSRKLMKNGNSAAVGWPRYWYFIGVYGNEVISVGGYCGGSGYINTTDFTGVAHFHQPYIYNTLSSFDP